MQLFGCLSERGLSNIMGLKMNQFERGSSEGFARLMLKSVHWLVKVCSQVRENLISGVIYCM